jgi:hypothetical protein
MDFVVIAMLERGKFMASEVSVLYRDNLEALKRALPEYVERVNKEFLTFNPSLINNENRRRFPFAITSEYNLELERRGQYDRMLPPRIRRKEDYSTDVPFVLSASAVIIEVPQ